MLPVATKDQNQTKIPPSSNPEKIPIFLPVMAYFYLTFNSISTIYKAYIHGDFSMVAFVVFVYFGYFCLIYSIKQLQDLPPMEVSPRKNFLKSVIWVITNLILLGFAYQFSTFIHPVAAVLVFTVSILTSSFVFFLYFVHDCRPEKPETQSGSSCCRFRIKILRISSPSSEVISDSKTRDVVAGPENV